jgi:hypothetical protein
MPVVCCLLHSQVVPVCAGLGAGVRVAYVQVPGGALPVSLSSSVRALKERGLIEVAVATGPCLDGDVACVNVASALAWAAERGFEAVVCSLGPGIVGTGTTLGHGAVAAAESANAAAALSGSPVLAARASSADPRPRHRGISHHTRAAMGLCLGSVAVAWPSGYEVSGGLERFEDVDVAGWEDACVGLPLEHMGRGPADDPLFFAAAFAAGRLAKGLAT